MYIHTQQWHGSSKTPFLQRIVSKIYVTYITLLPALTFTSIMTSLEPWQPNCMINVTILTFLSSTIPFSTVRSRHLLNTVLTCRSWFDIREYFHRN